MNIGLVIKLLSAVQLIEAAAMLPSLALSLWHGDGAHMAFIITIVLLAAIFAPLYAFIKPKERQLRAKEGFFVVAMSWLLLSAFGALPLRISGEVPNYLDAFFEAVSGFTTTGATIIDVFENRAPGVMFWRSFTHWIGGMGVLVLTLALLPRVTGRSSHLVRAESPGPSLSKIAPKMGDTAKILYMLYFALTLIEFIALMIAGLSPYDAVMHALSTAGTGGFSNYGASVGAFNSAVVDAIVTVFMVLFGVNFALYYQIISGRWRDALKSEELHWYLGVFAFAVIFITVMITPQYGNVLTALRFGGFQAASIMSTTGFVTADFTLWPQAAQIMLVMLMLIGSCAGSTAGGMKVVRVAVSLKLSRRAVLQSFQPRKVKMIRFEGKAVEESMLSQICTFVLIYFMLMFAGAFLITLDSPYDFVTNFTSSLSSISNVGPILSSTVSISSMSAFGPFAKIVMCFLMLAGRLELFPLLALFHPDLWKSR